MSENTAAVGAPEVTWAPTADTLQRSRMERFRAWAETRYSVELPDYRALWRWSITELDTFWQAVVEFFGVIGDGLEGPALVEERMPGAVWYPDATLNLAENVLRFAAERPHELAVCAVSDSGALTEWTWRELETKVAALAARYRELGVAPGDRVVGVLANVPEALAAFLAAASIGATWSVCSPDFSPQAIVDRLGPLEPVVLVGATGYEFKGRWFDTREALATVAAQLPTVRTVLVAARDEDDLSSIPNAERIDFEREEPLTFLRVPFAHPLWVLFSSGTTGTPKGIVHGHGGIVLESLKGTGLHFDLDEHDRYFIPANTSWMMWNTLTSALLCGSAVVTYAGAPAHPRADRQFEVVQIAGATMLATGAAYLGLVERSGLRPGDDWDLSTLRRIMATGSPLASSTWRWVHEAVKPSVHLSSDSGGTDICSGFISGNPLEPVHVGELQGPALGVALEVRAENGGIAPVNEVGEMVITRPMPSMPVAFWNDPDGAAYQAAYFEQEPGVWTHGDWISETPSCGYVVHGRSDATLNRDGVRLGSADIYAALQLVPEVANAVVLGIELPEGGYWMPLFVELTPGTVLDDALTAKITSTIRERTTARHVPDAVEAVPAIPVTHAGKRIEVPLKKLFLGYPAEKAVNLGALANAGAVDWFIERAADFVAQKGITREH
ncbi:MAG: acetoacetate--CoA ligase [Microbacteriaceae bacterium]|nr:acetoacetate--CoA ligase [Microbacteriaceae bacterium]